MEGQQEEQAAEDGETQWSLSHRYPEREEKGTRYHVAFYEYLLRCELVGGELRQYQS